MPVATTLEAFWAVIDFGQWHGNCRENMRRNAEAHLAMNQRGDPVGTIAGFMNECAASYLSLIAAMVNVDGDQAQRDILLSCMERITGGTRQECRTHVMGLITQLRDAAIALRDAPKTTRPQIEAACNAVLANVPQHLRLRRP